MNEQSTAGDGGTVGMGERDHTADDALAKELAADAVQYIADSEPDEETTGAQEILEGTPYAHMYVLNGSEIEKAVEITLSDAFYDERIRRVDDEGEPTPAPASPVRLPTRDEVERAARDTTDPAEAERLNNLAAMMRFTEGLPGAPTSPDGADDNNWVLAAVRRGLTSPSAMIQTAAEEGRDTLKLRAAMLDLVERRVLCRTPDNHLAEPAPTSPEGAVAGEGERWRAVEGGRVNPPDLETFRRAAEEDRCAYCGIVDPEVDGLGHCANCGGWLPPAESLYPPAPTPDARQAEVLRSAIAAAYRHGYSKGHGDGETPGSITFKPALRTAEYMESLPAPTAALLSGAASPVRGERERDANRIINVLWRYLRHYDDCQFEASGFRQCGCGLVDTVAALRAPLREGGEPMLVRAWKKLARRQRERMRLDDATFELLRSENERLCEEVNRFRTATAVRLEPVCPNPHCVKGRVGEASCAVCLGQPNAALRAPVTGEGDGRERHEQMRDAIRHAITELGEVREAMAGGDDPDVYALIREVETHLEGTLIGDDEAGGLVCGACGALLRANPHAPWCPEQPRAALRTAPGRVDPLRKYADDERPQGVCYDCCRSYASFPDLLVPSAVWKAINPTHHEGAGLLCPTCIAVRCEAAGLEGVPCAFACGPLVAVPYRERREGEDGMAFLDNQWPAPGRVPDEGEGPNG